uniref:DNA polymerase beta thumb domain-containing protein n=1 Tax=candidate division WOR-3 bacterium TaxID=2052148 RepID=A0A7C2K318_UNCW3
MAKIKERISYDKAREIVGIINDILSENGITHGVYGSYIRKEETIGDLDLLLYEKDCEKARKLLQDFDFYSRIEFYCIPEEYKESWESFALYLTGSGEFNVWIRSIAKNRGYLLNQYGLFDRKTGNLITTKEKEIFSLLGLKYIPPEKRSSRLRKEWTLNFEKSTNI